MRIAVLGATGAAGRVFVPLAEAAGHALVTQRADIFDRAALRQVLAGCDAAVNLVTSIPKPGGKGTWEANDRVRREGTATLLAACADAGVKVLLQQSVAMLHCASDARPQVETDPIEGEGALASAVDMERLCRAAPLDVRLVRGALFYGPATFREQLLRAEVSKPGFRIPGDGRAWLAMIHVADYASALLAVLERGAPREAYIAADDTPVSYRELYAGAAKAAGVPLPGTGGPQRLKSFRVSNAKLRALGWAPAHPAIDYRD